MNYRRILVIGNYLPDQQESMIRFAYLLHKIYSKSGQVSVMAPLCFISSVPFLPKFVRKYLSYIDKLFIFPLLLLILRRRFDIVHIADHSNAFYSFCFPRACCVVTCHDLLAVRGALGDTTAFSQTSPIGIWLQRLIVAGLRHASAIVFVSRATSDDFHKIVGKPPHQRHTVIPNSLNAPFNPNFDSIYLTEAEVQQLPQQPYLLMVGSSQPRKNRTLALQLLNFMGTSSPYILVFAGAPLTLEEKLFQQNSELGSRVVSIANPSHGLLNRLYCQAHALLFPSFSEGFGWPIVEAQACLCPVIASTTTSIPEVAGNGALFSHPRDIATFAEHVLALENPAVRSNLICKGQTNMCRFDHDIIANAYRCFASQNADGFCIS
jgi:glycosyltransferase involved in cell wall biosynthesis